MPGRATSWSSAIRMRSTLCLPVVRVDEIFCARIRTPVHFRNHAPSVTTSQLSKHKPCQTRIPLHLSRFSPEANLASCKFCLFRKHTNLFSLWCDPVFFFGNTAFAVTFEVLR